MLVIHPKWKFYSPKRNTMIPLSQASASIILEIEETSSLFLYILPKIRPTQYLVETKHSLTHLFPARPKQWLFFSRNIGKVTPKSYYFHYLIKYFLDQSIQQIFCLILKTEALVSSGYSCKCIL